MIFSFLGLSLVFFFPVSKLRVYIWKLGSFRKGRIHIRLDIIIAAGTIFIDFWIIKIFDIIHSRFFYQTIFIAQLIWTIRLVVFDIHGVISLFVLIVNRESLLVLIFDFVFNVIDLFIAHDHFYRNRLGTSNVFFSNMLYSIHVGDYLRTGVCILIFTTELRWGYLRT